jgi:hypothetical protein
MGRWRRKKRRLGREGFRLEAGRCAWLLKKPENPRGYLFAGAVAIGALITTAPGAQADPVGTITAQCKGLGGSLNVLGTGNETMYQCCYTPLAGSKKNVTCDYYDKDGNFLSSQNQGEPTPTLRPAPPGQVKPSVPPPQTAQ